MKILQLIYESFGSPFGFGGAGVRAYEIYRRLKDRNDITLLCLKYLGARDSEIEGLKHIFVGTESTSLTKSVFSFTIQASRFVRKYGNNFDIIVENFLPSTPFFSKFLTRKPVILQVQGVMEKHSLRKFSPFYSVPMYAVERFYPSLYDKFIFVSDITKRKTLSADKKGILSPVIPNGVNQELLRVTPENKNYILFMSRIDIYTKGLDLLINAFEQISSDFPDLRLVLAGYEFDKFDSLIANCSAPLREKITFTGFTTGEEKTRLLSGARVFILPSRHESSPISILEAAACGKPVIASDIQELGFVVKEGFGISFPCGSVDGLVEKMRLLLSDEKQREAMGTRGREFARQFLWDDSAAQFENVLKLQSSPQGY